MKSDEKRKKIIQAAGDCFARFGYEKTTMDDIGKKVGLNKASLYYYYKDKESIYTEVVYVEQMPEDKWYLVQTNSDKEN